MSRRADSAALLAVALACTGCVVPTIGPVTAHPASSARPFPVALTTPEPAPQPGALGGTLDVLGRGRTALVQGWVASSAATLVLVSDVPVRVVDSEREQRADAAKVMGRPDDVELGFRMHVRALSGEVSRLCVLARAPDGLVRVLEGSDPVWCPVS